MRNGMHRVSCLIAPNKSRFQPTLTLFHFVTIDLFPAVISFSSQNEPHFPNTDDHKAFPFSTPATDTDDTTMTPKLFSLPLQTHSLSSAVQNMYTSNLLGIFCPYSPFYPKILSFQWTFGILLLQSQLSSVFVFVFWEQANGELS